MVRTAWVLLGALFTAACGGPPSGAPVAARGTETPKAAVDSPAAAEGTGSSPGSAPTPQPVAGSAPGSPFPFPAGALYACAVGSGAELKIGAIELAPEVSALCGRNPEMGPCQYARKACRARGGRVFASNGKEITLATEAEYDRRVLRVRLQSN